MKDNKIIYKFKMDRTIEEKVESKRTNKDGEEETVFKNKKVKKPQTIIINKPTRRMIDAAEEYYAIQVSQNIKKGIVTKAMLQKKYADTGGSLTDDESRDMIKAVQKSNELSNEIQMLVATKGDKNKIEELENELLTLRKHLVELESSLQGIYQNTADARAERATLLWYVVNLTQVQNKEKEISNFFDGVLLEDKLENLYEKDESGDEFFENALDKIMKIVSYWHYTGDTSEEKINQFVENAG
jgi:hypothetical protein